MEVCRICGGTEALKCFQGNEQLTELLGVCANITIKEGDNLPKHICEQCEFGLLFSYRLRKKGEETEKRLRQEMQTQAISTTTDVRRAIVLNVEIIPAQPSVMTRPTSVVSEVDQNICTSTIEVAKDASFETEELSPKERIAGKRFRLETNEQLVSTSTIEICDENFDELGSEGNTNEMSVEERLRLELRKRGVIMCTRPEAEKEGLIKYTNDQHVIAGKRINLELPIEDQLEKEEGNDDDVIELIDEDSVMPDSPREKTPYESELNTNEYRSEDIIEEILSSEEEEGAQNNLIEHTNEQLERQEEDTDIVYEDLDDECEEPVSINECQIQFTKEEHQDFDCNEYVESIATQENKDNLDDDASQLKCLKDYEEETVEIRSPNKLNREEIIGYTCPTCNEVFDSHRDFREHIKRHGNKRFHCEECNKWFPQLSRLRRHAKIHQNNDDDRLQCPHCDRNYQLRSNLTRHIRTVHEKKGCVCAVCGEIFGRSDILKNHMAKHTEDRDFQCDKCPQRFKSNHYLNKHMRMHKKYDSDETSKEEGENNNPPSKKTYYCHYCGKVSKHHFTHKMHLRIHTQERPHKCEACSKAFRTLAALITHERIHDDVRPYQCEHCLLTFRQQGHLKEHRMIHEGITPHVCSICKLAFTKKNNMLVHMRIHSGENPYKCVTCDEQFKKAEQLRKHEIKVHNKVVSDQSNGSEILQQDANANNEEEEEDVYENDTQFADLTSDLLDSDSNSLELIEEANESHIGNNVISDGIVIQDEIDEIIPGGATSIDMASTLSNNLADDFNIHDTGVVLVVDDDAKFNSLFIMDD